MRPSPGKDGLASRLPFTRLLAAALAATMLLGPSAGQTQATRVAAPAQLQRPWSEPVRTESPRATLSSFLRLKSEMETALAGYLAASSFTGVTRLALISDQMNALLDLEQLPEASRREAGIRTAAHLMDIFGRLDPPDPATLPDIDAASGDGAEAVRIPGTSLYIVRQETGERRGEHLFGASVVDVAPRLARSLRSLPLRSTLDIDSFAALGPQLTGPLIPPSLVRSLPASLTRLWGGTPIWKVGATAVALAALATLLLTTERLIADGKARSPIPALARRALLPVLVVAATDGALPFFAFQINLSGGFADFVSALRTVGAHLGYAWLFWIGVRMAFEAVILSPRISDQSLDANLLRLIAGVIGLVGVVMILSLGGQAVGLPILSVLAGLGIGGLAVALALRPTLENLVGGVMLYIDRPVRVGDFCKLGEQTGTVETIGVRSTKLRALDRTLISVPNAQFADMQIVNYAHCDRMLIHETLGVRYETTPDQLRHLLAGLRRMLHAHPRIDPETVRARFAGFGDHALAIDLRVYAATREWNDYFAIREDVLLRVADVVAASGSGFAFPSQTLYLSRDHGLDAKRAEAAAATVSGWRRSGALPFPRLSQDEIEKLRGRLDYPPLGSAEGPEPAFRAEPLGSEEPEPPARAEGEDPSRRG